MRNSKEVRDELNEGDQILLKVLAIEGTTIKLSRRAILKEQRVMRFSAISGIRSACQ